MNKQVGVKKAKVVLTNTCTGQKKVIVLPDDHPIVTMAVEHFSRTQGVSVRQVDIQISAVQSDA